MSRYKLNKAGEGLAESLIAAGWVDHRGDWSFTSTDGNRLLGDDGQAWDIYGGSHLGVNPDAPEQSRGRFGWPIAKVDGDNKVRLHTSGLKAILDHASEKHEGPIREAAKGILERCEKRRAEAKYAPADMVGCREAIAFTCSTVFEFSDDEFFARGRILAAADGSGPNLTSEVPTFMAEAFIGDHALKLQGYRHRLLIDTAGLVIPRQRMHIHAQFDKMSGIGHTEKIRLEGNRIVATGIVSRSTEAAREFTHSIKARDPSHRFPWKLALIASPDEVDRVEPGQMASVNGKTWDGPLFVARRSTVANLGFVDVSPDTASWGSMLDAAEASDREHEASCIRAGAGAKIRAIKEAESLEAAWERCCESIRPYEEAELKKYNDELDELMDQKARFRECHGPARLKPMGPTPIQQAIAAADAERLRIQLGGAPESLDQHLEALRKLADGELNRSAELRSAM
ncbi:MAG: hypothetical protein ABSH35_33090 [Isosphaeraceae bacterium]|jgi:hypothetical protein